MRYLSLATLLLVLVFATVAPAQVPASSHVFLVVEENASYSQVIGSSSMPYLNSLASKYGLATQYYADTHPSIGNYFMMTTGQILTNDDSQTPSSFPVSADNIVRHILTGGKTWKSYAEDLPYVGYTGGDTGNYAVRHNPFPYFTDVQNSSAQVLNLVPFTQFATDLANNTLPNYSFIVPNLCDDAHNCSLSTADNWLKTNIAPLIASSTFQQDGLLVILFDESLDTDTAYGGGHIAMVVISPKAKTGYQSTTLYQHESTLRMLMEAVGLTPNLAAATNAPDMGEFFASSTPPPAPAPHAVLTVTPQSGTAPLAVTADSSTSYDSGATITSRSINFGDGTVVNNSTTASHTYNSAGYYTVTLTITDSAGLTSTATQAVSVTAPAPISPSPTAVLTVSPQSGGIPLTVTADSSQSYETGGTIVSRSFNFGDGTVVNGNVTATHVYTSAGSYTVTLTVTDAAGLTATATQTVNVKRHGKH